MKFLSAASAALIAAIAVSAWFTVQRWRRRRSVPSLDKDELRKKDAYSDIEPLNDFDWENTPPLQVWPFRSRYHLTMGLENLPLSDLVAVDRTYLDRINIRRSIMDQHPAETKQCNKIAESAVLEFYNWMITTYLPLRFPTMYRLSTTPQGPTLLNLITQTHLPIHPPSPLDALDILGSNVDTDFMILLPTTHSSTPIYHLQAFITCFPTGFSTLAKLGLPLSGIHSPVPGYASKLEKSMDRFFAKLECGRAVKRSNWSITTNDLLYAETGNHMYADDDHDDGGKTKNAKTLDVGAPDLQDEIERQKQEVVIEECRLRCERQTLHRLEKTKALVFAFKTYQYKLFEVKEAGAGPELAAAIDGLAEGSVPAMAFYKRGVVWGDKVKEYLTT